MTREQSPPSASNGALPGSSDLGSFTPEQGIERTVAAGLKAMKVAGLVAIPFPAVPFVFSAHETTGTAVSSVDHASVLQASSVRQDA